MQLTCQILKFLKIYFIGTVITGSNGYFLFLQKIINKFLTLKLV
jgi:hypothetical protein